MSQIYFNPKDKEIEKIFEKLINYPLVQVPSKKAQVISRYNKIRELNRGRRNTPLIIIKGGMIALNPKIKISKKGNGFNFDIF